MKKSFSKSGILIAILVIPAFIFIFLKFFGSNKFDLPYYFPEIAENGEIKIVNGDTVFYKLPSFKFADQNGQEISNKEESIKVVSFFFTRCGTICPPTNRNLQRVQELFKDKSEFEIFSFTIDPKYDNSQILKKYAIEHKAIDSKWHFLTGDKKSIYDFAIRGCKLSVADAHNYDLKINSIDEAFIHSDKILLIDRKGYFRGIYTSTDKSEIERLIVEIKVLLKQKG